jgi:hypothetical protein
VATINDFENRIGIMSRILRGFGILLTIALIWAVVPAPASAQVDLVVAVNFGPPAIPYYEQPPNMAPNYIWMPGYWAWGYGGYYWVPGTWVAAAEPGYLWTPGYWAFNGYNYTWNDGYWATQVGYYGGIDYGYGYFGSGYNGGGWQGRNFRYNTAYTNVNQNYVRNVYSNRGAGNASNWRNAQRISYNGGRGGVQARPSADQLAVSRGRHVPATAMQRQHIQVASGDRNLLASVNKGRPQQLAVARPFAANRRPANYTPVRAQDRQAAVSHVVTHQPATLVHAASNAHMTGPRQPQTVTHAATVHHAAAAPVYHAAAPVHHAAAAPVYHAAAPVHHAAAAPVYHAAAPVHHAAAAPVYHAAAPVHHAAPAYRAAAPVRQAPVYHAAAPVRHVQAPAYHAVAPVRHVAPPAQHAPPARPAAPDHQK